MQPSPSNYSAVVHSPPDTVNDAHDFLKTVWGQRPDIGAGDRMAIETALSELVTNVIQNNPHRPVLCEVTLAVTPAELVLRTADTGDPLVDAPTPSMPGVDAEHGRGLALIELIADDLSYSHEGSMNVWQVTKARSPRN
ncbi:MAG: ATP-binding protein [Actinobacteria bacterium HGW-Actinobacteria-5]|jgi:serine/threonine-protein kinase RsbW|nr:MAG: ATP-binding protein [Actinobacteria bacterium HGW-Actinobacteria-5]